VLNLVNRLTAGVALSDQTASLVVSQTPDRPWLDLAYQLSAIVIGLGPIALVWYLLVRSGEGAAAIGVDRTQPARDSARGLILAVLVGGIGLAFYLLAYRLGISVAITAVTAVRFWWTTPMLLLSALQNALLEEVVILGYFLHRSRQAAVASGTAVVASSLIRGTYHLYQGFGGFIGNFAMGLLFGWLYLRWGRCLPLVIAHFAIDAAAFVGYLYLRGQVSWLP
jgi:membrane protease YdiL (CAAX protease family)